MNPRAPDRRATRRRRPLSLALAVLAPLCAAGPAMADDEAPPPPVRFSAKDLDDKPFVVPAPDRPTLLVFVMAGQGHSREVLAQMQPLAAERSDAQTAVVLSGDNAVIDGRALREAPIGWMGPIVADTSYEIAGLLAVRAWPTTVVVDAQGHAVAHLAGLPASYRKDLEAHLDAAGGRIDADTLRQRLASNGMVVSTPQHMASRHLQVAMRLLDRRQVAEARQELEKALKLEAEDPHLHLAVARAQLMAGEAEGALSTLEGLDRTRLPAWQIDTLRGRVLVALRRWDQARTALDEALKLNPDPVQAHYFLGRVRAHEGAWPEAAAHFRAAFEHSAAAGALATQELADEPPG